MAGSLRDQLIKAGLATADQAKKAERQVKAEKQARGRNNAQAPSSATVQAQAEARKRQAEKIERDRALAQAANEKVAAKARAAEIRQLILQNDQRSQEARDDDVPYNFVHGKKIKRIYVTPEHRAWISAGNLVIATNEGRYHLVPPEVAEKIAARDPRRIITIVRQTLASASPDDEFYAKFKVPDDLDW